MSQDQRWLGKKEPASLLETASMLACPVLPPSKEDVLRRGRREKASASPEKEDRHRSTAGAGSLQRQTAQSAGPSEDLACHPAVGIAAARNRPLLLLLAVGALPALPPGFFLPGP